KVDRFFGKMPENLLMVRGDAREIKFRKKFDRVILDIPNPWEALENLSVFLRRGGFLINYSPNIGQVQRVVEGMRDFTNIRTFEILERDWVIDERRARPNERMFGHTGFITVGRKL
ncbi:MAG: tRNA (adenine-N1)-methyltransferase, partial [Candidatus Aenigmatarchaeota archaeon]